MFNVDTEFSLTSLNLVLCWGSVQALAEMNGKELEGEPIEIVFAKPPDQKRKERKAQRQAAKTQM